MIIETDADAQCFPDYRSRLQDCPFHSSNMPWMYVCTILLQCIYTLECAGRAFVERSKYVPQLNSADA